MQICENYCNELSVHKYSGLSTLVWRMIRRWPNMLWTQPTSTQPLRTTHQGEPFQLYTFFSSYFYTQIHEFEVLERNMIYHGIININSDYTIQRKKDWPGKCTSSDFIVFQSFPSSFTFLRNPISDQQHFTKTSTFPICN